MTTRCQGPGCGRPVSDAKVCASCRVELERSLGEVPALAAELETALGHRAHRQTGQATRTLAGIVLDWRAQAAHTALRDTLRHWATQSPRNGGRGRQNGAQRLSTASAPVAAIYLLGQAEQLRHHPSAPEAFADIRRVTSEGWKIVDLPALRTTFPVGPCPQEVDGQPCPGEVRAYFPRDEATPPRIGCAVCGAVWYSWQWTRAGERILRRRARLDYAATRRMAATLDQVTGGLTNCA